MFLHLANYSSALAKSRLKEITSFDLVVLMGDELERSDATPFKQDAPTKWIYNALTDANYTAPLKHKPLLLEGGFGAWELAYPMHVESAQPRDLETVLASLGVPDRNPFTTRQAQSECILSVALQYLDSCRLRLHRVPNTRAAATRAVTIHVARPH